jgi:hypothetical protein
VFFLFLVISLLVFHKLLLTLRLEHAQQFFKCNFFRNFSLSFCFFNTFSVNATVTLFDFFDFENIDYLEDFCFFKIEK